MARNFMFKTSSVLYSITNGISKIHQLEREYNGSLKFFKSIKVQSKFIHFVMNENDKNVPLIICDFHTKFSKGEISRSHI